MSSFRIKISVCLLLLLLVFAPNAKADSPLTSIEFYKAYEDIAIVQQAIQAQGQPTEQILAYLDNEKNLIDIKMAVINALGWQFEGRQNAQAYFSYVNRANIYASIDDFLLNARSDQHLCYAYLLALDNYFDVTSAATIASAAAQTEKTVNSYTFQLVSALINAQFAMDYDWCQVYTLTNNVRKNANLKKDFRMSAIPMVFEYMDLYADECN